MPIFMDRHDMRDVTAEAIAAAHHRDLEVQDKYGVKYMTYWFDQQRGTGFCLVDAPESYKSAFRWPTVSGYIHSPGSWQGCGI